MQEKHKDSDASGFVFLDKPAGITSFQLLFPLKRQFQTRRVGHAGTLDQEATGLMVTALGKCTRLLEYIEAEQKLYSFRLHLGRSTDTLEYGATIVEEDPHGARSAEQLLAVRDQFLGLISQIPPKYSAIKIDGRRASDMVREGLEVEIKPRSVEIFALDLVPACGTESDDHAPRQWFDLICHCSKGTYIRSLGRDLAHAMGTCGSVSAIRRLRIGNVLVEQGQSPEDPASFLLRTPEQVLPWPQVVITAAEWTELMQGRYIGCSLQRLLPTSASPAAPMVFAMHEGRAVCAGRHDQGRLYPSIQLV